MATFEVGLVGASTMGKVGALIYPGGNEGKEGAEACVGTAWEAMGAA